MKVVIFSDSHGELLNMIEAVEKEEPNQIFHLGDVTRDADNLQPFCPNTPIVCVTGNCDSSLGKVCPLERVMEVGGLFVFLLHGHSAHVKNGLEEALRKAGGAGASVLLFGHTHQPYQGGQGGLQVMNPGSIRQGNYGILEVTDGVAQCTLRNIREDD